MTTIQVGDSVKPNFKTLRSHHIRIRKRNYPWAVSHINGQSITVKRANKATGRIHYETWHEIFLVKIEAKIKEGIN